jgi:hypothetical protein
LIDQKGGCGEAFIHGFAVPVFGGKSGVLGKGCHPVLEFPRMHERGKFNPPSLPFQGR